MSKLEQYYTEQEHQQFLYTQQLNRYALSGHEPLREVLTFYSKTRKDFSSDLVLSTLSILGKIIKSSKIRPYMDFDPLELNSSWQFQLIIHDLKIGISGKDYIPPLYLAQILDALVNIKYKDAELVNSINEFIIRQSKTPNEPLANQVYKDHVYSGFQNNEEFKAHIMTLVEWKARPQVSKDEILAHIEKFTEYIHDFKFGQKNLASAIANINHQYYMLVTAQRENPELTKSDAVTLGLNNLQELLVEAGILNPYDLEDVDNFEDLDKLMGRAERTFNNIVGKYFPEINNKGIDRLYEATKEFSEINLPEINLNVPNPNTVNAEVFGNYLIGLGKMMNLDVGDVNESNDYPNIPWERRARPTKCELDLKRELFIELPYTKLWIQAQKAVEELLPAIRNAAKSAEFGPACMILHGLGDCRVYDKEIVDSLCQRIAETQRKSDFEVIAGGIFGLGLLNVHKETGKLLLDSLVSNPELKVIGFPMLIRAMWGACALDLQQDPGFQSLFLLLNEFEPSDLTKEDTIYFRDVMTCIEYEVKIPNSQLSTQLSTAKILASNHYFDEKRKLYDPIKPYLRKLGRFIMTQNLPESEAIIIHKRVREAEASPLFKCDDVIALNGFYTYLFLSGSEGIYKGHLLGTYALKSRVLKSAGKRGLPVPINEILEIDPFTPDLKMKNLDALNDFILEHVGIPENYLSKMDTFTSEFIKIMREEKESISQHHISISLLEDLVGAYKLQNMARCKTGPHLYAQGLEEVKLQLLKAFHRFNELESASQGRLNDLAAEQAGINSFQELLKEVNALIPTKIGEKNDFWLGFRQLMHLPHMSTSKPDITDEFINHKFLMVPDYFHYKDWAKEIHSSYPLPTDMALYEDGLFNNFHFLHRRQQIGMIPDPLVLKNSINDEVPEETRAKVMLTNIKYELKRNFSDKEIVEKILGMKVLEKVIEEHLRPRNSENAKKLSRDPAAYTEFVNCQIKQIEDTDQYAKFFREIWARDAVKSELLEKMKKNLKAVASSENMDSNEKLFMRRDMIIKYTNTKEALDMDDPERGLFYNPIFRQSFGVKSDPRYLRKREYDIREDPDFMDFDNDADFLSFKQRKAESNLIKLRIFNKLHNNTPLSSLESEYLSHYKKALDSSSLIQAGKVFVPQKPTSLKLEDLPPADSELFKHLHKVRLSSLESKIGKLSLNELLFELSHFLDDYLVSRIEFHILEKKELNNWGVSPDQNGGSKLKPLWNNKGLWWQNCALEEYIWRKTSHLTESETKDFLTLFGYEKNKSFRDQVFWKMDTKSFEELMQDLDGNDFKLKFIREWWQRKVQERKSRLTVPDGKFAQSDKKILLTWYNELCEIYAEEFNKVFGIQYNDIREENLYGIMNQIKNIVYGTDTELVKNMVRMVYFHPSLPERMKEELYGIINNLNIEVYEPGIVSFDPIKVRGDKLKLEVSDEEWRKRLENASVNFLPELINKLMN